MSTISEDLDRIKQQVSENSQPLTNIPGLFLAQDLNTIKNRELHQSISEQAQPQDQETAFEYALRANHVPEFLHTPARWLANYGVGIWDSGLRGALNTYASLERGLSMLTTPIFGENNMFHQAANMLNDWDEQYAMASEDAINFVRGGKTTNSDEWFHGFGTSTPYWLLGILGGKLAGLKGLPKLASNTIGYLTKEISEALTEASNVASEVYAQDKTRSDKDILSSWLNSFVPNVTLDTLHGAGEGALKTFLDYYLFPNASGGIKWLANEALKNTLVEVADESLQEPRQQLIETAVKRTAQSGNNALYPRFLAEEARKFPEYFEQTFIPTLGSTVLGSIAFAPFGFVGGGKSHRQNTVTLTEDEKAAIENARFEALKRQRENLQTRINNAYSSYGSSLDTDLDALQDIQDMEARLQNLDNYIANFWGDTGVVINTVQDDDIDLFPDGEEPIISPAQDEQLSAPSETTTEDKNTPPKIDLLPEDQQITIPANNPLSPTSEVLPPITGLRDIVNNEAKISPSENAQNEVKPKVSLVEETPASSPETKQSDETLKSNEGSILLPPVTGLRNEPQNSNIARVRTMRGTEADVQYRVVEADNLVVSTLENGEPNPAYPQEYQPRQRNREASRRQVDDMANDLQPELLGENPLASDGAPIIGSDLVVESGNGRVMAIKQAYKRGKAQNYRSWLKKNASKFGLNSETLSKMKNPVLVRERISEVDKVKFTSEANESSTAQMSASENAINDAKKITDTMLADYDTNKPLAGNKSFIQSFLGLFSRNERGNLLQSDGKVSRSGLERMQNALTAKAYNDTSIINRLSEVYDDDIKNISNALIQAAPKIAILQNSGIRQEHSITEDIMQAANILVNLRQEGRSVGEYLGTLSMFDDVTPEAQKLLKFFDDNKRSAKRIAQGLINYAEGAMNEAKQSQAVMFADSIRTKGQILDEAINHAQNDSESYHQTTGENTNQEAGHFNFYQDGKAHQFTLSELANIQINIRPTKNMSAAS
ncbi:MAG: hypothetical protein IJU48_05360 [Synergistaceae bacterium]|nr:hypothetical protein [Synergistaceae bacterium]